MDNFPEVRKETKTVSARDLHKYLEATERFSAWFERQLQYGFIENQDYTSVNSFTLVGNGAEKPIEDFALTIDCAKEISMLQKTEKGKKARQHFIKCEKELYELKEISRRELAVMIIQQEDEMERLLIAKIELEKKEEYHRPMVEAYHLFQDSGRNLSIEEAAKVMGIRSRNALFAKLMNMNCVTANKKPTPNMIEHGYMTTKLVQIKGQTDLYPQTFITPKGLEYLAKRLGLVVVSSELIKA